MGSRALKKSMRRERRAAFQAELDTVVIEMSQQELMNEAHAARQKAISWRDCKNGGAAIVRLSDGRYVLIKASNYKPHEGPRIMFLDYCAEMALERKRRRLRGE